MGGAFLSTPITTKKTIKYQHGKLRVVTCEMQGTPTFEFRMEKVYVRRRFVPSHKQRNLPLWRFRWSRRSIGLTILWQTFSTMPRNESFF
jgi:hypothetical protein